jgi:CheY-like chemotaxis protein
MMPPAPAPRALCVAVCDDDLRFIRLVERMLGEVESTIVPVTTLDPDDAVRVIAEAGCDAALIDLNIYNDCQAGLTLVRLLREHPATASLPLLLATAASVRDVRRHDAELRALNCGVLAKPFSVDALFDALGLVSPTQPAA